MCLLVAISCTEKKDIDHSSSGYIHINGVNHYYNITGKGDTLITLHGGPGLSHKYMMPQMDALLSSDFTLLFYDQRGSGWTGGVEDTTKLTMDTFVEDLEQIRIHFGISKVHLLGHSFGGLLAMYYGIAHPSHVGSLVLVDPDAASYALRTPYQIETINARITEKQWEYLDSISETTAFKNYDPASYDSYYKMYLTSYFAHAKDTAKLYLGFDSTNVKKIDITNNYVRKDLGEYDIHHTLSSIHCPTLILQGTESVFSIDGAEAIHTHIPNSELVIFENCGHFEYIESPVKFKNTIMHFYKKY